MIAFPFQPKRAGKRSRLWSARIKLPGWTTTRTFPLKCADKRVAAEKLREKVRELEMEAAGLSLPRSTLEGAQRPILEHLQAFLDDAKAKGRSPRTVTHYRKTITRLCSRCGWRMLRDVSAHSFVQWRANCGLSAKFTNDLLGFMCTFLNWLERQQLIAANPLRHVGKATNREVGCYRRALSVAEIEKLLRVAPPQRASVYLVILYTGLRRRELISLRWRDVDLEASPPRITAPASITKNGKIAVIPLRDEAVAALRQVKPEFVLPAAWVYRGLVPGVKTLQRDLAAAGIAFKDDRGRRVDLHALRTTFATLLSSSGVSPRVAMEFMRQSDIRLTMSVYTDVAQLPLATELERLPSLSTRWLSAVSDSAPSHTEHKYGSANI